MQRRDLIASQGFEPTQFAYERAIGKNDSLYSNFAELIALTKRKVGRIVLIQGGEKLGYATGFMVSSRLLLTNWHVFQTGQMAEESEVHFFYEYDVQGRPQSPVVFKFDTSGFFNDQELDYCFVAVQPADVTGKVSLESIGYLHLDKALGKIGDVNQEKLNIIHHPLGDFKQISIRENTFVGIDETKIFYEADTNCGSSGSPVLNDQWQVVGLHHMSIAKTTPDGGNYLDKDDKVIPIVNGQIDASQIIWLKNEGMRISVILDHVNQEHPQDNLVAGLAVSPPAESAHLDVELEGTNPAEVSGPSAAGISDGNLHISVPATLLATRSLAITLTDKVAAGEPIPGLPVTPGKLDENLLEIAKITREQEMDFSQCEGYKPEFLGVPVPLPQPKKGIRNQIARLPNNEIELKYFKHSVIFNAVTRMPLISAVNVEGDLSQRPDNSKRNDDWLRDKRIELDCQLTDSFYSHSNFDKGHMSRFEDANWGPSVEQALRNGIYTCFYTNACPQAVKFNRAGGVWGKLELAILERGIKTEEGEKARMVVFNGPIFNQSRDRIFKGVRIPMEFYKVILWRDDQGSLKATAFKLSQENKLDDIKFDEAMRLATEALDIDKVATFKSYQCSLKSLGKLTNIDFKNLEQYDTFKSLAGGEENLIRGAEEICL